jgi:glycerol-3-phosphate acyltransferase PlsY
MEATAMREVLALVIGYLLGSVLPADLFARARGVDIRAVGTRNPGATNALRELGTVPGTITLVYDAAVGPLAMWIASALGLTLGWTYLAGVAAIVGHVFPVFFRFRGGQGMAAATGLLVYSMGIAVSNGDLTPQGVALLAACALTVFLLTRSATVVGVLAVPILLLQIILGQPDWRFAWFAAGLAVFIWVTQAGIARERDLFHLIGPVRTLLGRLRPRTH